MPGQLEEFTALELSITQIEFGALPGYEGDARLHWNTLSCDTFEQALELTNKSLGVLRAFWDAPNHNTEKSSHIQPVGVDFTNFYRFICSEILLRNDDESFSSVIIYQLPLEPVSDSELLKLANIIVSEPDVLQYFLIDVRDWDAFRLLMRRHNAALCVVPIEDENNTFDESTDSPVESQLDSRVARSKRFYANYSQQSQPIPKVQVPKQLPRVFIRSGREASLESRVSELEKLLAAREEQWETERVTMLKEREDALLELNSVKEVLKEAGGQALPKKSILRKRSSLCEVKSRNDESSSTAGSPKRSIHWDQSVTVLEAEREKKMRVEATFMSLYAASGSELDDYTYEFSDNVVTTAVHTQESFSVDDEFTDEDSHSLDSSSATCNADNSSLDEKVLELTRRRSADLLVETQNVDVKKIKKLYEAESLVEIKKDTSSVILASGRRPRPASVEISVQGSLNESIEAETQTSAPDSTEEKIVYTLGSNEEHVPSVVTPTSAESVLTPITMEEPRGKSIDMPIREVIFEVLDDQDDEKTPREKPKKVMNWIQKTLRKTRSASSLRKVKSDDSLKEKKSFWTFK